MRHLGPDSSLQPQFTSVRQSRLEPLLVPGVGGSAQAFSGPPTQSSSTIGRGSGCGLGGMSTFIPMPTHGSIRLDRAWRSIIQNGNRSEEHTSELQSRQYLVCRLL